MANDGVTTLTVHGGDESCYTGKLEAYLRAKGIAETRTRRRRRAAHPGRAREEADGQLVATWCSSTTRRSSRA